MLLSVLATTMLPVMAGFALARPASGQGRVQDFRLPPAPTPTPDIIGPVDENAPARSARPVTPTGTPTGTGTSTPAPRQTATPSGAPATGTPRQPIVLPQAPAARTPPATATPVPTRVPSPDAGAALPRAGANSVQAPPPPSDPEIATEMDQAFDRSDAVAAPVTAPPVQQPVALPSPSTADREESNAFGWLALILAAIAALAAFLFFRSSRAKSSSGATNAAPLAVRPKRPPVPPAPPPASPAAPAARPRPAPVPPIKSDEPLEIIVEQIRASRSMMAITFAWRLRLTNNTAAAIDGMQLSGDITCAHGQVPTEQQLATDATALPHLRQVPSIPAGDTVELKGEIRLPVDDIVPIRQGAAPVLVPLLRLRIAGEALGRSTRNWVVGLQGDAGGRLQPFPLGDRLQTYGAAGARLLA